MTILFDVFKELFKMFVADLRLTLGTLAGVALIAGLLAAGAISAPVGGALLTLTCVGILFETVLRETNARKR